MDTENVVYNCISLLHPDTEIECNLATPVLNGHSSLCLFSQSCSYCHSSLRLFGQSRPILLSLPFKSPPFQPVLPLLPFMSQPNRPFCSHCHTSLRLLGHSWSHCHTSLRLLSKVCPQCIKTSAFLASPAVMGICSKIWLRLYNRYASCCTLDWRVAFNLADPSCFCLWVEFWCFSRFN